MTNEQNALVIKRNFFTDLQILLSKFFKSSFIILAVACYSMHLAFNTPLYFPKQLGHYEGSQLTSLLFLVIFSYFAIFIIPALTAKFLLRENLSHLGLRLPEKSWRTFFSILIALFILLPLIVWCTKNTSFQRYYDFKDANLTKFLIINIILYPFYYFAEEFYYRGFLFLGLWQRLKWHSFWLTDIIFAVGHLGKPGYEILLSMFASIIFNALTLATRSIFPALFVHWMMGTTLIVIINWHYFV